MTLMGRKERNTKKKTDEREVSQGEDQGIFTCMYSSRKNEKHSAYRGILLAPAEKIHRRAFWKAK